MTMTTKPASGTYTRLKMVRKNVHLLVPVAEQLEAIHQRSGEAVQSIINRAVVQFLEREATK